MITLTWGKFASFSVLLLALYAFAMRGFIPKEYVGYMVFLVFGAFIPARTQAQKREHDRAIFETQIRDELTKRTYEAYKAGWRPEAPTTPETPAAKEVRKP